MELIRKQKGVNGDFICVYKMDDGTTIAINERTGGIIGTADKIIKNQDIVNKIKLDYMHLIK
jgi:hypothetical protein